jgi:hypothetical protein
MPTYKYEATDTTGAEVKATVDARNEEEAQQKIRSLGYFVTRLTDMSGNPTPPTAAAPPPAKVRRKRPWFTRLLSGRRFDDEVAVYRHSNLFYWWPVWLVGFIFAAITYLGDQYMAIVPDHTVAAEQRDVDVTGEGKMEKRDVLILPKDDHLHKQKDAAGNEETDQPRLRMAPHHVYGTIYLFVLLVVIVITNITLRGLWSILVVTTIVLLIIILYLANVLGTIFHNVGLLWIYINLGGYFLMSGVLFALWAINFFFLDRMTYMIFTPGQVRVRLEIGGGEMVYDATGMTIQKQRNDIFRHWGLGLGSGDLLIYPLNAGHAIELPNVLRVGRVVREIEQLVKEKVVVASTDRSS